MSCSFLSVCLCLLCRCKNGVDSVAARSGCLGCSGLHCRYQLFDVVADPQERRDLANHTAYAHILKQLLVSCPPRNQSHTSKLITSTHSFTHSLLHSLTHTFARGTAQDFYESERKHAHYPQSVGPEGNPVFVNSSSPLSNSMPVWLPWL